MNYGSRTKSVLILQKVGLSVWLTALIEDQALPEFGRGRVEAAGCCQIDIALEGRDRGGEAGCLGICSVELVALRYIAACRCRSGALRQAYGPLANSAPLFR